MYYQIQDSSFDNYQAEQALNFSNGYDEGMWSENYFFPFMYSRLDILDCLYTIIRDFNYSNRPEDNAVLPIILVLGRGDDKSSKSLNELVELIQNRKYPFKILIVSLTNNTQQCDLYYHLESRFPDIFLIKYFTFDNKWIIVDEIQQYFTENGRQSHFILGFSNNSDDEKYFFFIKSIYAQVVNNCQPKYYCCFVLNQSLYRLENQQFILQRHCLENQLQYLNEMKQMQKQVSVIPQYDQPISYQADMQRDLEYQNYVVAKQKWQAQQEDENKEEDCKKQCWRIIQIVFWLTVLLVSTYVSLKNSFSTE